MRTPFGGVLNAANSSFGVRAMEPLRFDTVSHQWYSGFPMGSLIWGYVAPRNAPGRANPCTCPSLADLRRSGGVNVLLCILKGFALSKPPCLAIQTGLMGGGKACAA